MAVPPPHLPPVPSPRDRGHKCVSTTKLALGHKPFPSAERFQGLPKPFPPHSAGLSEEKKEQHREGFRRGKLLSQGTASSLTEKPRVGSECLTLPIPMADACRGEEGGSPGSSAAAGRLRAGGRRRAGAVCLGRRPAPPALKWRRLEGGRQRAESWRERGFA